MNGQDGGPTGFARGSLVTRLGQGTLAACDAGDGGAARCPLLLLRRCSASKARRRRRFSHPPAPPLLRFSFRRKTVFTTTAKPKRRHSLHLPARSRSLALSLANSRHQSLPVSLALSLSQLLRLLLLPPSRLLRALSSLRFSVGNLTIASAVRTTK